MGRASKLKQQRHSQHQDNPSDTPAKAKYVLLEPQSKNYIASSEFLGGMNRERINWSPHPGGALQFASANQAQAKAKQILKGRGYSLQIIQVIELEGQLKTELISEVNP